MILRKTIESIFVLLFSKVPVRRLINGNTLKLPLPICRFYKDGEEVKFHKILELWSCAVSADVGAHIGLTTFIMSQECKKVVAFEPSPKNVKFLRSV
jgi:hypothetical protein